MQSYRIVAILAGGNSRRMANFDKANFELGGRRLIDLVIDQVIPQANLILLSAKTDYGTGLDVVPDHLNILAGPVAGLWAIANWIDTYGPKTKGFFTVPVDAPFIRSDLFDHLEAVGGSAVAQTKSGPHPTFGYWEIKPLMETLRKVPDGTTISLNGLAKTMGAIAVKFEDEHSFANINRGSIYLCDPAS